MGIIDTLRKSKEKPQEHEIPPPKGHVLAEIMKDKKMSHLFGKHLEKEGKEELAARLVAGELTEEDIQSLEEQRSLFSEKILQAEKITKLLTKENVIDIAKNSEEFAKIISIYGVEQLIKMVQNHILEIFFTDEERFQLTAEALITSDSHKNGQYKRVGEETEKLCNDNNISQTEYLEAIAIADIKERNEALKKLVTKTYGKTKKFFDKFGWVSGGTVDKLELQKQLLERSIDDLNVYQTNIGAVLAISVIRDDFMRNALSRELMGDKKTGPEPKPGFSDAKQETEAFDDEAFNKEWLKFRKDSDFDAANDSIKDDIREEFISEQTKKYREREVKGKSLWHSILATLFEKKISNKKDKLK